MKKHLLEYIDKATSDSVRGLRILVEYFHALEIMEPVRQSGIKVVSVFGSARLKPGNKEYESARKLGRELYENGFAVVTGASQGIMEAANQGVVDGLLSEFKKTHKALPPEKIRALPAFQKELSRYSLGLKISLPFEPMHNPHLGVVATFHYFMVRKFFFANLSSAFIACEGGWGTRDELFEIMTLVQTGKMPIMPIVYVSSDPRHLKNDLGYALKKGYISAEDLRLINFVSNHRQAVAVIKKFYQYVRSIFYDNKSHIEVSLQKPLTGAQKSKIKNVVKNHFKDVFSGVRFYRGKFVLCDYRHQSYGTIRKVIDCL